MASLRRLAVLAALCLCLAATTAQAQPNLAKKDKIRVAFSLLDTINDQGWTTAHYKGIEEMKQVMGDKVEIAYTEKLFSPADAERVIRKYAEEGYDIIFATTFGHMDPALNVAKDFPNTVFEHCSGYKTAPNMGNYFARMEQAEYLAGYMAGLMGYKNVGTVATQPIPEPIRGINAFTIGLLKGLKERGETPPATPVTVAWLKSWRDPINETTLAETLVAKKHDLIRQMADTPDSAAAACAAGVPAIGYGADVAESGVDCALVSTLWNWGPIYVKKVQQVLDGTWKAEEYFGGFKEGDIKLSAFHASVPKDVQDKVLAEMARLQKGEDTIFAGPLVDTEGVERIPAGKVATDKELLTMDWLVKGVAGSIPK
ncbi:BMP family ABC transporter substrate-binding protein [Megalodesulfovibrio paquesii]